MNQPKSKYAEFSQVLALVNEMIEESAYHTETFAHVLEVHHNSKATKVFLRASEQFNAELAIIKEDFGNVEMPNIPPWETPYPEYIHPSSLLVDAHYLMTEVEASNIVESMVKIHQDFYSFLRKESSADNVIDLVVKLVEYCEKCGKVDNADIL